MYKAEGYRAQQKEGKTSRNRTHRMLHNVQARHEKWKDIEKVLVFVAFKRIVDIKIKIY